MISADTACQRVPARSHGTTRCGRSANHEASSLAISLVGGPAETAASRLARDRQAELTADGGWHRVADLTECC